MERISTFLDRISDGGHYSREDLFSIGKKFGITNKTVTRQVFGDQCSVHQKGIGEVGKRYLITLNGRKTPRMKPVYQIRLYSK